jgi:hypothetical protein
LKNQKNTNTKKVKDPWEEEVKQRIKFGIPSDEMRSFAGVNIPICSLKIVQDYNRIYDVSHTERNRWDKKWITLFKKADKKYTEYTFKQLEKANGALELSKTCQYVYPLSKNNVEYEHKSVMIYYRHKNAVQKTDFYPEKVIEVFKKNSRCRAVVFLYLKPLTRKVIVEKNTEIVKKRSKKVI